MGCGCWLFSTYTCCVVIIVSPSLPFLITDCNPFLVVVGPTPLPIMVEGSNIRLYAHRPMVSPTSSQHPGPLVAPPFNQQVPHIHGNLSCVFMLVQFNKCVVCGSDLQSVLYVSFGSKVRPRTFRCVAMGSALLFIVRCRLLVYSAGSGVNRVQIVLSGFSKMLYFFVLAKTLCRYGCMYFLAALELVCVDVIVMSSA